MIGVVKNYVFGFEDYYIENINIPTDYIFFTRLNGNFRERVNHNDFQKFGPQSLMEWQSGFLPNRRSLRFFGQLEVSGVISTNNLIYDSNILTISFYIYIEEIGGNRRLLSSNSSGAGAGSWQIFLGSSDTPGSVNYDKLMVYYRTATNTSNVFRTATAPPTNEWLKIVIVINKNSTPQRKVYINDVEQTMVSVSSSSDTSNFVADKMRVGVNFSGKIQRLLIYNRELSILEMSYL